MLSLVRFVGHHPRLRALFATAVTVGIGTFVPVWLVQLYATDAGVALSWLGPIWAIANYVVAIGSALSDRTGRALGLNAVMLACVGLLAVGYFGMGLTTAWWGFVFYFCFNLVRGLSAPLIAHSEQDAIPSGDRASLVSMRSLLFRAAFIAVGPAAGAAVDAHGHHPVLLALGGAGAYGFVMSSNYNSRPRAAEILVDGDQAHLARQRESFADIGETLAGHLKVAPFGTGESFLSEICG